jgi:hypothetical protein
VLALVVAEVQVQPDTRAQVAQVVPEDIATEVATAVAVEAVEAVEVVVPADRGNRAIPVLVRKLKL